MSSIEAWRGIAAEEVEEVPQAWTGLLRRRTRHLIASLGAPHRRAIILLGLAIFVSNLAGTAVPYLVGLGIDRGIASVRHGDYAPIAVVTALIVVCAVLQALLYQVFVAGSGRIGQEILLALRERVFAHFQRLSLAFHERYTTGRMIARLTSDLEAINDMFTLGLDTLINAVLSIVSVGVILLVLDLPLGLVCLSGFIPLWFLTRWYQRESTVAYRNTRNAMALVIVHFTESLRGIRAVQSFRRQPRNDEIFGHLSERYRTAMSRSFQLLGIYWPGIVLIGNLTTAAVLLYGGLRVIDHEMEVGVLAAFVLYLRRFFEPLAEVSQFYDSFQAAAAGLEKLAGVLDEEPGVPMPAHGAALPPQGLQGTVDFRQVRFGYREGKDILSGFDLHIPAGQTVALLGATGAGKSTVARLLVRFYDPLDGEVSIDDIPLAALDEVSLHEAVAMVTQESFLFSGTVAENIAFGSPAATEAEIAAAARAVGVDSFVESLGNGYESDVGKQGSRLSAGQRQLVALARAFLADPAVLVLDEASSSLDAPMERLVQSALKTVLAGRTAVIIAHRLSTVEIADRVLVLESGRIVEDGPPDVLLAEGSGHYAALYESWRESLV
ncbi:MAG TPA: ABC transporter ATP-binding protein [Acidimicrobiales bacterium]|nr:ABC transporter ATP-binding protein [Acidimicrobiales bacterium]